MSLTQVGQETEQNQRNEIGKFMRLKSFNVENLQKPQFPSELGREHFLTEPPRKKSLAVSDYGKFPITRNSETNKVVFGRIKSLDNTSFVTGDTR